MFDIGKSCLRFCWRGAFRRKALQTLYMSLSVNVPCAKQNGCRRNETLRDMNAQDPTGKHRGIENSVINYSWLVRSAILIITSLPLPKKLSIR